jgi:hypothetical protein
VGGSLERSSRANASDRLQRLGDDERCLEPLHAEAEPSESPIAPRIGRQKALALKSGCS